MGPFPGGLNRNIYLISRFGVREDGKANLGGFLQSHSLVVEAVSHQVWNLPIWLTVYHAPRMHFSLCLMFDPNTGTIDICHQRWIFVGTEDPNSGPHGVESSLQQMSYLSKPSSVRNFKFYLGRKQRTYHAFASSYSLNIAPLLWFS